MEALRTYRADMHIHTCLSPCGDLDMSPRGIVAAALAANLDIIAVCDHNTAENVAATIRAAERDGQGLRVLAGMEVCSLEEVHVLALFESCEQALDFQTLVYDGLPNRTNRPDIFGEQVVANEDDEVEAFVDRLLIAAIDLNLSAVVEAIHERHGLAVASHVDRPAFGLFSQLGFLPPGLPLDGVEISARCDLFTLLNRRPELADKAILRNSDAHFIEDVGKGYTEFDLMGPTLEEIAMALKGEGGRCIRRLS